MMSVHTDQLLSQVSDLKSTANRMHRRDSVPIGRCPEDLKSHLRRLFPGAVPKYVDLLVTTITSLDPYDEEFLYKLTNKTLRWCQNAYRDNQDVPRLTSKLTDFLVSIRWTGKYMSLRKETDKFPWGTKQFILTKKIIIKKKKFLLELFLYINNEALNWYLQMDSPPKMQTHNVSIKKNQKILKHKLINMGASRLSNCWNV